MRIDSRASRQFSDGSSGMISGGIQCEWAARVAGHAARRPPGWTTVETADLAGVLRVARGAVLVDSLGSWVARLADERGLWEAPDPGPGAPPGLDAETADLVGATR